jgi:hypothetical protein
MGRSPSLEHGSRLSRGDVGHAPAGFDRGAADVRGEDDAFTKGQEPGVDPWLILEDIQTRAPDLAASQSVGQR